MNDLVVKNNITPYIKIIEQPSSRGARFRYQCEGRYSGSILGVNSTPSIKTYPSIEIVNHKGAAFVVVSCVTKDPPYRPHPHNIVGKGKELSQGICFFKIPPDQPIVIFPNLGIQCVKKKDIYKSLTERERMKVDPYKTGFNHKFQPESIDLSCVRFCFQVFLEGQERDHFNIPLEPVVSNPIYDKKAAAELTICWLSHASASVAGGKVMCVLCEKIAKDDIQVRFFREENGWEAIAESTSPHYHKQVAVIFKTPQYHVQNIDEPVLVHIQLKRPSDGETSRPIPFQLLPLEIDDFDSLRRKRQKFNESPKSLVLRHLQAEATKNAKLGNVTKSRKCNTVKTEPWELTSPVHSVDPKISSSLHHSQTTNNLNILSDRLTAVNNPQNNRDIQQMRLNQMQEIDYSNQNSCAWQTPMLYNNITVMQQQLNPRDIFNFESQSFHEICNEPQIQQSNSYMDELLTTIIDENFPNNLSISGDL